MNSRAWLLLLLGTAQAHCPPDDAICQDAGGEAASLLQHGKTFVAQEAATAGKAHERTAGHSEHYWSSRGGDMMTRSYVPYEVPSISRGPAWTWPNELKEQVRHSPLIDSDMNIYITTTTRIRKLSSDGNLLWTFKSNGKMVTCPTLVGNELFALVEMGTRYYPMLMSIDLRSGALNWNRSHESYETNADANSLSVYNGTMFFAAKKESVNPNTVVAVNSSDGELLWDYQVDEAIWNFAPASPGDGTLLLGGSCGQVWRLSFAGELLWRAGPAPPEKNAMCSPGGGALGPNGIFYNLYSREGGHEGTISAHRVSDGFLLWEKTMAMPGGQYPAVGQLGPGGKLAVVLPLGNGTNPPMVLAAPGLAKATLAVHGPLRNALYALDAATGDLLWQSEDEPYNSMIAAGEIALHNPDDGTVCWPDSQAIPLITGDGTVFAASGHHGQLRSMKDKNGDGVIDPTEVSIFETHQCFLNSPSAAPGMLVAAPCWGPVYVFKD